MSTETLIEALRLEIAELRKEVGELKAGHSVHHHYHAASPPTLLGPQPLQYPYPVMPYTGGISTTMGSADTTTWPHNSPDALSATGGIHGRLS